MSDDTDQDAKLPRSKDLYDMSKVFSRARNLEVVLPSDKNLHGPFARPSGTRWISNAVLALETVSTVNYLRKNLGDQTGVLHLGELFEIIERAENRLPAGKSLLIPVDYKLDFKMGGFTSKSPSDASAAAMTPHLDKLPLTIDPDQPEGRYFIPVYSNKDSIGVPPDSPEKRAQLAEQMRAIAKCQKGVLGACQDPETKEMADIIDNVNSEIRAAMDERDLSEIAARWMSADPKEIASVIRPRWANEGVDQDDEHDVDDAGQPTDQKKPDAQKPSDQQDGFTGLPPSTTPVDAKPEPGAGEPGGGGGGGGKPAVLTPSSVRIEASAAAAGAGPDDELARIRAELDQNQRDIMRFCAEQIRSVRRSQQSHDEMIRPARAAGPYKVDPDRLRKLVAFSDAEYSVRGLTRFNKTFYAILGASDELRDFYDPVIENGYDEDRIANAMRLFGFFKKPGQPLAVGDVASMADPMTDDGFHWIVVVATNGGQLAEALICNVKDKPYKLRKSNFGPLTRIWCPALTRVLADDTPAGAFWGPNLSRLSAIYGETSYVSTPSFIPQIFRDRYPINDYAGLIERLGSDLRVIGKHNPMVPGAIVVGDKGTFGVVARERRIRGYIDDSSSGVKWHTTQEFPARWIWYPRTDA